MFTPTTPAAKRVPKFATAVAGPLYWKQYVPVDVDVTVCCTGVVPPAAPVMFNTVEIVFVEGAVPMTAVRFTWPAVGGATYVYDAAPPRTTVDDVPVAATTAPELATNTTATPSPQFTAGVAAFVQLTVTVPVPFAAMPAAGGLIATMLVDVLNAAPTVTTALPL